ncbi:MAG: hypothetical protein PHQ75_07445 [Thermoguttaceae bacterium]|nr:hypothetical protein [Thermoguttaceae bacterium]
MPVLFGRVSAVFDHTPAVMNRMPVLFGRVSAVIDHTPAVMNRIDTAIDQPRSNRRQTLVWMSIVKQLYYRIKTK